MDEVDELTAKFILKREKRLRMALHVIKAMPIVRLDLSRKILKGVWKRIESDLDKAVEGSLYEDDPYDGFMFWPKEGSVLSLCVEIRKFRGQPAETVGPVFSVYREDNAELDDKQLQDLVECFNAALDGYDMQSKDNYVAQVNVCKGHVPARWDIDFLEQMAMNRKEIESCLADLMLQVYDRVKAKLF